MPAAVHTPSAGDAAIEPLPKLLLTLDLPAGSLVGVAGERYHETALEQTIALDEGAIPLHGDDECRVDPNAINRPRADLPGVGVGPARSNAATSR